LSRCNQTPLALADRHSSRACPRGVRPSEHSWAAIAIRVVDNRTQGDGPGGSKLLARVELQGLR
jgi:hypothetical protein